MLSIRLTPMLIIVAALGVFGPAKPSGALPADTHLAETSLFDYLHAMGVGPHPKTVADIDCGATMKINNDGGLAAILTPRKMDPEKEYGAAIASAPPEMAQNFIRANQLDPNGLCGYRDKNALLPPATGHRVVFLGDSITAAWDKAAPDLFVNDVIDRGITGQTTGQMLARFRYDVIDLKPRVVHIMAGVNDVSVYGTALTRSNIMSMVELAKAHDIVVVLGAITPVARFWMFPELKPAPQIVALNHWLRDYARQEGLIFVDYHAPLADAGQGFRDDLSNEGVHPNRDGYAIMTPLARAAIATALVGKP